MKIFIDTNVYIAEALRGRSAERAIRATLQSGWRLYISEYVGEETERVLVNRLGFSARQAHIIRQRITLRAELVDSPLSRHHVQSDPDDSPILRAALHAGVDYLVTRDNHLLEINQYESVRMLSLSEYLQLLSDYGLID